MGGKPWPPGLKVATVGQGSREELMQRGFAQVISPAAQSDSEALLDLPELAKVRGRRIVIFRGDGGRQLLGETLAQRGASVEYAACYRRVLPAVSDALRAAWEGAQKDEMVRIAAALRAALPTAQFEEVGDRATMAYGSGGTVQLLREHGAWKIEDFD